MSSGLAIEMRIWSKAGTCTCCLKRLVISFIGSLSWKGAWPTRPFDCVVHRHPLREVGGPPPAKAGRGRSRGLLGGRRWKSRSLDRRLLRRLLGCCGGLGVDQFDVEAQGAHLLDEHV